MTHTTPTRSDAAMTDGEMRYVPVAAINAAPTAMVTNVVQ